MEKGSLLKASHAPDAVSGVLQVLALLILSTILQISINRNIISILEIKDLGISEINQFSQC